MALVALIKKEVLIRLKLMRRDIINGEVVKLKITHDITKLVSDQIRINCIKKKRKKKKKKENTGRLVKLF